MGAVSPYGKGLDILFESLIEGKSAITSLSNLADIKGLRSWVAGLVNGIDPKEIPRKYRRSMSNMSIYATMACREALDQARLNEEQKEEKKGSNLAAMKASYFAVQKVESMGLKLERSTAKRLDGM